jgi:hypothetical protein
MKSANYGSLSFDQVSFLANKIDRGIVNKNVLAIGCHYLHSLGKFDEVKQRIKKIVGEKNFPAILKFLVSVGKFPIDAYE